MALLLAATTTPTTHLGARLRCFLARFLFLQYYQQARHFLSPPNCELRHHCGQPRRITYMIMVAMVRLKLALACSWLVHYHDGWTMDSWPPVVRMIMINRVPSLMLIAFEIFFAFIAFTNHFMYFQLDQQDDNTRTMLHQILLDNSEDVVESNGKLFQYKPHSKWAVVNWCGHGQRLIGLVVAMWNHGKCANGNQKRKRKCVRFVLRKRMTGFPLITDGGRMRLFLLNMMCEAVFTIFIVAASKYAYLKV